MSKGQRGKMISLQVPPDTRQQLNEILELAKLVKPTITRTDVIINLVKDQYRKLVAARVLPLPKPPEIVEATFIVRSNGHDDIPNGA